MFDNFNNLSSTIGMLFFKIVLYECLAFLSISHRILHWKQFWIRQKKSQLYHFFKRWFQKFPEFELWKSNLWKSVVIILQKNNTPPASVLPTSQFLNKLYLWSDSMLNQYENFSSIFNIDDTAILKFKNWPTEDK